MDWPCQNWNQGSTKKQSSNPLLFQFKYRIQAHRKIAMAEGVLGKRIAIDSVYNIFFNDTGMKNGCKAGDLKARLD